MTSMICRPSSNCCVICGLNIEASMVTHLEEHVNDPFFECPDCANLFGDLNTFKVHLVKHDVHLNSDSSSTIDFNKERTPISDVSNCQETNTIKADLCKGNTVDLHCLNEGSNKAAKSIFSESTTATISQSLTPVKALDTQDQFIDSKKNECVVANLTLKSQNPKSKPYQCKLCDRSFAQTKNLLQHERKHADKSSFTCDRCGASFKSKQTLESHIEANCGKGFKCHHCMLEFQLEKSLMHHLKRHEGKHVLYCSKCNIPYANSMYLNMHIKKCHRETKCDTKCNFCDMHFRYHNDLLRHERSHTGEKPFICKLCGKAFAQKAGLKNHDVVHSGEKPHQCTYCGVSFSFANNLKVHVRVHTGERPYACNFCDKTFFRSGNLREHVKLHTGEKSYKCEICSKSFASSSTFIKHKKIHTGERPYKCNICEKSFIQAVHLTKHTLVHTGERPYSCSICKKTFNRTDTLKIHMRIHSTKDDHRIR